MSKKKDKEVSKELRYPVGVTTQRGIEALFLRALRAEKYRLLLAAGKKGISFTGTGTEVALVAKGKKEDISLIDHISASPCDKGFFMTFVQKGKHDDQLVGAVSKDFKRFTVTGKIAAAQGRGTLIPNYKCEDRYFIYCGTGSIKTATSKDLKRWKISEIACLTPRSNFFDHAPLAVLAVSLTPSGILVIYDASRRENNGQMLRAGGALFSLSDPNDVVWRSESPLWEEFLPAGREEMHAVGGIFCQENVSLYYATKAGALKVVSFPQPFPSVGAKRAFARLKRFYKNPIIVPDSTSEWESEGVFNPAAVYDDGKVHMLYRAVSRGGLSSFGYASSKDGFHIDEKLGEPAYVPRKEFEGIRTRPAQRIDLYKSGCGWGGCEDPKLTVMDDKVYLTYVAFNGYSHPRLALSSIDRDDFLQKNWKWKEPVLISRPGVVNKSGCILPEKVKGKYVIFHRVFPHILIDYRDDLCFGDGRWLEVKDKITTRPGMWDSRKVSVGATPIKTEAGWLVIYHAVDDRDDSRYKVGAMILDPENPAKVLCRTSNPILSPEAHYENEGKPGVVYPCGAVVLGDELFVYYGGGDRVVCCATAQLSKFITAVQKDKPVTYELKEVAI